MAEWQPKMHKYSDFRAMKHGYSSCHWVAAVSLLSGGIGDPPVISATKWPLAKISTLSNPGSQFNQKWWVLTTYLI